MIVGLDVATRRLAAACPQVGFAFSTGTYFDKAQAKRDWPSEADAGFAMGRQLWHALQNHAGFMRQWAADDMAAVFAYERPLVGRPHGNVRTAVGQALSAGATLSQLRLMGDFKAIDNSATWKKELIGHGHTDKAGVRAWLEAHHPALAQACGEDQDLVDAHCISLWASGVGAGG